MEKIDFFRRLMSSVVRFGFIVYCFICGNYASYLFYDKFNAFVVTIGFVLTYILVKILMPFLILFLVALILKFFKKTIGSPLFYILVKLIGILLVPVFFVNKLENTGQLFILSIFLYVAMIIDEFLKLNMSKKVR